MTRAPKSATRGRRMALRPLLTGGDRRSIALSSRAREIVEREPERVAELVALTDDPDRLVVMRALDLLEKLAHDHPDWIEPHKRLFIGPLADRDEWEIRLQIVRAMPLFAWTAQQRKRVVAILRRDLEHPQKFVRTWSLDSLAMLAEADAALRPLVMDQLDAFERSGSKALQARARRIQQRLASGGRRRTARRT